MKDTFEFTLKEKPSEELFEMLSDVNVETTPSFTIQDTDGNIAEYVKLIRCKDCKHYAILEDGSNELICDHKDGCMTPKPDGFCNYAEPKRNTKL